MDTRTFISVRLYANVCVVTRPHTAHRSDKRLLRAEHVGAALAVSSGVAITTSLSTLRIASCGVVGLGVMEGREGVSVHTQGGALAMNSRGGKMSTAGLQQDHATMPSTSASTSSRTPLGEAPPSDMCVDCDCVLRKAECVPSPALCTTCG